MYTFNTYAKPEIAQHKQQQAPETSKVDIELDFTTSSALEQIILLIDSG